MWWEVEIGCVVDVRVGVHVKDVGGGDPRPRGWEMCLVKCELIFVCCLHYFGMSALFGKVRNHRKDC